MTSRYMEFPSPHGVHVPETYYNDTLPADDPYRRPSSRRNRYTRSISSQTPRIRDVTWISSPDQPTPQTPYAPPSPWISSQQAASMTSPGPMVALSLRPPSPIPPTSPAPTVGEHMTLDELAFVHDTFFDPYYQPQRPPGLFKSFWKGLKKLSGFRPSPSPSFPIPIPVPGLSTLGSHVHAHPRPQSIDMPVAMPVRASSLPSETTQYVNPTPSETQTGTEDHRIGTPYASPYARLPTVGAGPMPMPMPMSMSMPTPTPMPVPTTMPTPPVRPSPAPAHHIEVPPVRVVSPSPSIPPSPLPSAMRPPRPATPGPPRRSLSAGPGSVDEGSQTLHEPVFSDAGHPPRVAGPVAIPVARSDDDEDEDGEDNISGGTSAKSKLGSQPQPPTPSGAVIPMPQGPPLDFAPSNSNSKSPLTSTMARLRRFLTTLDGLPWLWDEQIADEYVPELNPRSRLRARVRQGAEPSWYNPRPEVVERPAYWAEWDMWAKQSTAALWDGTTSMGGRVGWAGVGAGGGMGMGMGMGGLGQGQWGGAGAVYPHGYAPVQPGLAYPLGYPPPGDQSAPVLP